MGSGPAAGGGQVQLLGGGQSSQGGSVSGGVSILCPLAGGMPVAFTQEDFLVYVILFRQGKQRDIDKKQDIDLQSRENF